MADHKLCPHCGHANLPRAKFCFQCGKPLQAVTPQQPAGDVAPRRSQRAAQAMLGEAHVPEPVTCLACGALNSPTSRYCNQCGELLIVPDQDARLVPHASARTDIGQLRENNEDSVGLWALHGVLLALVADGMGGAAAGEEASRLTLEAVQADFVGVESEGIDLLTLAEEVIMDKLAAAIQAANMAVIDRVDEDSALRGMGTTATLAFIRGRRALFAHVGDSRAYLVDGMQGWINQITSDHSFVEALLAAGHITEAEAADHPMKNVLYRALGQAPDTAADVYDRYLKNGDRIVLCSDGLTRHIHPDEIAQIVLLDDDPEAATQRLIDLANERGGEDNISAIVILMRRVSDDPQAVEESAVYTEETLHDAPIHPQPTVPSDDEDTLIEEEENDPPRDQLPRPEPVPTIPSDTEHTLIEGESEREQLHRQLTAHEAAGQEPPLAGNEDDETIASGEWETLESVPQRDVLHAMRLDAEDERLFLEQSAAEPVPQDEDDSQELSQQG